MRGGTMGASVRAAEMGVSADFPADEPLLACARCACSALAAITAAHVMTSAMTNAHTERLNERFLEFTAVQTRVPWFASIIGPPPCRDVNRPLQFDLLRDTRLELLEHHKETTVLDLCRQGIQ